MAAVKWETDRVPGVYTRVGVRGRTLVRHVYRDTEGKQVNCSKHPNITDARRHQREMLVNKPQPIIRSTLRETYDQRVADAEAAGTPYAPTTLDGHEASWKYLSDLAGIQVGKITPKQVTDALARVPGPEARIKVRHLLTSLGAPVPTERKPRTRSARMGRAPKPIRELSSEELARLVEEMPERYKALVKLMAYVGLRPGEAVSLRAGKLDTLHRKLTVDTALGGFTKTGEPREIELPPTVVEMLSDHLAKFSNPSDPDAPMFPREDGGAIDSKFSYDAWSRRHFREAAKRADVNHGLSPNDLRHFAAARAIKAGIDIYRVQRMLGHARPSITLDTYAYLFRDDKGETAAKLDEVIRQAEATRPEDARVTSLGI